MHLLFENLVPNMILHWTGKFKGIDEGVGHYRLPGAVWDKIGELTAASAKTIPSAFVGTIPDIAQDRYLYKAEAYAFWAQYIAPIVLKNRLPQVYYRHFLLMREIIILCIQIDVTAAEVDELERMVNQWVADYERLYYQYQYDRLPACPLTIHALLHLPFYLRRTGPLCNSWTFVTERFCGRLLPAVKNRYQPYEHMDYYISRRAQMQAVCHIFGLPMLPRSTVKWRFNGRERLSSRELMYPDFQHVILGSPVKRHPPVDVQLTNQMITYFGTTYSREEWSEERQEVLRRIDFDTLVRYGRFRLTDDGDRIRTASSVERSPLARDNSFIRYDLLPDANARFRHRPDVPVRVTHYGRVLDAYYLEFIEDIENNTRRPFVLARVMECVTGGLDAALPENPYVVYNRMRSPSIIHIHTINAVIGRIQVEPNTWAIIDASRHGARTQFVDDDDDDE
ncbi:hypothetical protein FS749_006340 [Ceratobasidium sp. UAMH 11750]|nr:hypothetical protein FS749_006340 [Ceratobasidium sp. UAMH 11750]